MQLRTLFIRFYKSFNHDYLRRTDHRVRGNAWDQVNGKFFPFVEIPLDGQITAVVGANESGKSHLLDAIERGVLGHDIERRDFCRNSELFTSEEGLLRLPDFGFEWHLATGEQVQVARLLKLKSELKRFFFFRTNEETCVYLPTDAADYPNETEGKIVLSAAQVENLVALMPQIFRLKADVALPDRVSLAELVKGRTDAPQRPPFIGQRRGRQISPLLEELPRHLDWFANSASVTQNAAVVQGFLSRLNSALTVEPDDLSRDQQRREEQSFNLAYDLLCRVAKIDVKHLADLDEALLRKGNDDGYAQSIVENINIRLDATFNFSNVWAQDREFKLAVTAGRDNDLTFTIRDRTGRNYSFSERSAGLKYFLSYYIQYLAHPTAQGDEILLMDEPDTFLSSRAQSDLLKIFHKFAVPDVNPTSDDNRKPVQVIYVTHSPFLIDKNFVHRVRVLEKGSQLEGTRVVKDASIRHYEPLRTAFNGFYGETAYIGSCNLIVEGAGDQILLAGAASLLNRYSNSESESLDLNRITIVPCEGSGNVPYMVIQARGRDLVASPPLIVLLDSDKAGKEARKQLGRGKSTVKPQFILEVSELVGCFTNGSSPRPFKSATGQIPLEIEDLVPLPICVEAARLYCTEVCDASETQRLGITEEAIMAIASSDVSVWDAIKQVLASQSSENHPFGLHMEKAGFARYVVDVVSYIATHKYIPAITSSDGDDDSAPAENSISDELRHSLEQFEANMKIVFRELSTKQRLAEDERNEERIADKVKHDIKAFVRNWPVTATKERIKILFESIQGKLTDNDESDEVRKGLNTLRRKYELESEGSLAGEVYEEFKVNLESIRYAGLLAAQGQSLGKELVPREKDDSPAASGFHDDIKRTVGANGDAPTRTPSKKVQVNLQTSTASTPNENAQEKDPLAPGPA